MVRLVREDCFCDVMVTKVDFYSGATDKWLVACRLSAKAVQHATSMIIYIPDANLLRQFDKLLWTFSPISFVPHCRIEDSAASKTPVILSERSDESEWIRHYEIMLNLHNDIPPHYKQFQRVIEIVGIEPEDREAARARYRFYQEQGLSVHHHRLDRNQE